MKKVKVSFTSTFNGQPLQFKDLTMRVYENWYSGGVQQAYKYPTMGGVSQAIRQFMKQVFPKVKFQIKTDSYSGGDSARVYILSQLTPSEFQNVKEALTSTFQEGRFNGMEDIYEYNGRGLRGEVDGEEVSFGTKYLFVERPYNQNF